MESGSKGGDGGGGGGSKETPPSIETKKDDLNNMHLAAIAQIKLGHYTTALAILQKAITAKLHLLQGQRAEAFDAQLRAADLVKNDVDKWRALIYQMAKLKFDDGKYDAAIELLCKIVTENNDASNSEARLLLANAYEKLAMYDKAIPLLQRIISLNSSNLNALLSLACCCHHTGDAVQSFTLYQQAIKLDPRSLRAHLGLGDLLKEAKQPALAVQSYQHALRLDPSCEAAHTSCLTLLVELGQKDEAKRYFTQSFYWTFMRKKELIVYFAAQAFKDSGELEMSMEVLQAAMKRDEKCPRVWWIWGDILHRQKLYEKAIEKYKRGVEIDPKMADLHASLGHTYKDLGELHKCVESYEAAVSCDPSNPTLVFNLAQGLEYVNLHEKAISTLTQYLAPLSKSDLTTLNHHAIYLLLIKLLFITGQTSSLPSLVALVLSFPPLVVGALQQIATHWAYFYFLSNLLAIQVPPPERHPPFFVIGDSHCLSCAWHSLPIRASLRTLVPRLVTGLKAWHLRPGFKFLTSANLHLLLDALPPNTKEVLFVCGEIDCREGIKRAVEKKIYASIADAVKETVKVYVRGLQELSVKYKLTFWIHPVPPPANPKYVERAEIVHQFNSQLAIQFGDRFIPLSDSLREANNTMKIELNCDGTHLSPRYLPLLAKHLQSLPPCSNDCTNSAVP